MNDMTNPAAPPAKPAEPPTKFPAMLNTWKAEIARALPKHMNADRVTRIALTAFRQTPGLDKCDPLSVFAAVVQSAQLGLEVGLMGEAHLVPFNDRASGKKLCQLIPGYQGLMKLARNSGLVQDIYAYEVRERDEFKVVLGLTRSLTHEPLMKQGFPASEDERGPITGFYAVAVFKDGSKSFQAMSKFDVERIRNNSKGYIAAKKFGRESTWDTDFVAMGIKTVIRRLCKYMPKSPELATALALDDMANKGRDQALNLQDALEGSWTPAPDEDLPTGEQPPEPPQQAAPEQKPAEAKPPYDEAAFKKNVAGNWKKAVAAGTKTIDELISTLQTKNSLTEEQLSQLRALAPQGGAQ